MRPPGYEPGELPTAPLRDVISYLRVQRYCYFLLYPNISPTFLQKSPILDKNYSFSNIFALFSCLFEIKCLYLHTINKCAIYKHRRGLNMSISKTRQKLVDVARQLFAKNGLENTTMNDIAVQSGKGRRTLYTYFRSKEEV